MKRTYVGKFNPNHEFFQTTEFKRSLDRVWQRIQNIITQLNNDRMMKKGKPIQMWSRAEWIAERDRILKIEHPSISDLRLLASLNTLITDSVR